MAGVLRAEPVWVETFTGLQVTQFARLLRVVRERGGNGTLRGRPWSLPLAEQVLMVAVYYRTNLTMRRLGPLFGVSSSTVCRVVQRLGPLLAVEPVARPVDADTRLVIAAARPVPGTTADAHAWRASGLSQYCKSVTVLGDGVYLNCGMAVPHRKRPGRVLLQAEEDDNAEHRRVRARVEHVIGRLKNYKILRDCRQRGDGLHHAAQAIARMHNLALAS
ncbi:transposase family protein (plasmid) [Streptomyces sp. AHU1]|uniref:transposase family protein n=1 Tax=Streptomyces sp. AHU1 TaxID=3377215 RepID=UPI0038782821